MVKPDTVIGEEAPVAVTHPGVEVTVYEVIDEGYPLQLGAVKVTETEVPLAEVAVPIVGAPGNRGQIF